MTQWRKALTKNTRTVSEKEKGRMESENDRKGTIRIKILFFFYKQKMACLSTI
jgi:hypothetical protein